MIYIAHMGNSVARAIADSLKEGKWLYITYDSTKGEKTFFWIAITDITPDKYIKAIQFNDHYSLDTTEERKISFDRILEATVLSFTSYDVPDGLLEKIRLNPSQYRWLHFEQFDNRILSYLEECNKYDVDPFQKRTIMLPGVDKSILSKGTYPLDEEQFKLIVSLVYQNDLNKIQNSTNEFAISLLSIDIRDKKYVVAYKNLAFDVEKKTLRVKEPIKINPTFLMDNITISLHRFTEWSVQEFEETIKVNFKAAVEEIESGCLLGEQINTRPEMMVLERDMTVNLSSLFERIEADYAEGRLTRPLRAYFGDLDRRAGRRKNPSIVVYDKKVNVDQLQVIYDAAVRPVTYVQGPPGTGKTNTIFNLLISEYFNSRTVLVCTYNNKPVDGIVEKFTNPNDYIGQIEFPYIRLGNHEVMIEATERIRKLLSIKSEPRDKDAVSLDDALTDQSKNDELVRLLEKYDEKREISERLESAERMYISAEKGGKAKNLLETLEKEIKRIHDLNASLPEVSNEDALALVSIASESELVKKAMKDDSTKRIRRLKTDSYAPLREIIAINDKDERAKKFRSWLMNDNNMTLLTRVFPIVFSTIIPTERLGVDFKFDLMIMDESGQADIAKTLIPLSKCENALLVGDPKQLQPVIVLDPTVNDDLKRKYEIDDRFDYASQSVLTHCLDADKISPRLLLSYHYRSGRKIANFCNKRFYQDKLKLDFTSLDGSVKLFDLDNNATNSERHTALEEAVSIAKFIKENGYDKEKEGEVLIITPFNKQEHLINTMLAKFNITNCRASTIHSVQGGEADTVFFSPAISEKTNLKTFEWVANQDELINVGWTRAKKNIFIFADSKRIETFSKNLKDPNTSLAAAIEYAKKEGNAEVIPPQNQFFAFGMSNGSNAEDAFYETITQLFSVNKKYRCERNIKCSKIFDDAELKGRNYEYDFVIYQKGLFGETITHIFEVAGPEHRMRKKTMENDKIKRDVAVRHHVKWIMIPNRSVKDYETFKALFECTTNNGMSEDDKDKLIQGSLFEEETIEDAVRVDDIEGEFDHLAEFEAEFEEKTPEIEEKVDNTKAEHPAAVEKKAFTPKERKIKEYRSSVYQIPGDPRFFTMAQHNCLHGAIHKSKMKIKLSENDEVAALYCDKCDTYYVIPEIITKLKEDYKAAPVEKELYRVDHVLYAKVKRAGYLLKDGSIATESLRREALTKLLNEDKSQGFLLKAFVNSIMRRCEDNNQVESLREDIGFIETVSKIRD